MKLNNYLVKSHEAELQESYTIDVPIGSKFVGCKATPVGIVVWYEVPAIQVETMQETFKVTF